MALRWSRVAALFAFVLAFVAISARDALAQESSSSPPAVWRPGQPAPDGFIVKKSKPGKALVIAGTIALGTGYVPMFFLGIGGEVLCATWPGGGNRAECAGVFAESFIPIAGPFLLFGESDGLHGGFGKLFLVSGILQSAGAASLAAGLALDATATQSLVPVTPGIEHGRLRVHVAPMIGGAFNGAMLIGSF